MTYDTATGLGDAREQSVVAWLLDSDPAIRWQVQRDLLDVPESEWSAERVKVETSGWGAQLLAHQDADGQWAGGAFVPANFDWQEWQDVGQPWTATSFSLTQLRLLGLDPASDAARRTVELIGANSRWDNAGQPFWEGEVEDCINGRTVTDGAYFGVDVAPIVSRLVGSRRTDGGWNCDHESTRSSFASTINVLEGLLAYEVATGGTTASRDARLSGEEYLLQRGLFRRLSTGDVADPAFLRIINPYRWHYDVLRALEHFRAAAVHGGTAPDARLAEAVEAIRSRRGSDGRWPLDVRLPGRVWIEMDEDEDAPSRWVTLRAAKVLRWWSGA